MEPHEPRPVRSAEDRDLIAVLVPGAALPGGFGARSFASLPGTLSSRPRPMGCTKSALTGCH